MREHTKSYVTERTHKLDTVLRSIYAVRHPLCTREAFYKVEIATALQATLRNDITS